MIGMSILRKLETSKALIVPIYPDELVSPSKVAGMKIQEADIGDNIVISDGTKLGTGIIVNTPSKAEGKIELPMVATKDMPCGGNGTKCVKESGNCAICFRDAQRDADQLILSQSLKEKDEQIAKLTERIKELADILKEAREALREMAVSEDIKARYGFWHLINQIDFAQSNAVKTLSQVAQSTNTEEGK